MKLKQKDVKEIFGEIATKYDHLKEMKCLICKKCVDCDAVPLSVACTFAIDKANLTGITNTLNELIAKQ